MTYPKIHTIYKRCPKTKRLLVGNYSRDAFRYLRNNQWIFTEKIDGMNIRIIYNTIDKKYVVKGRTDNAIIPDELLQSIANTILVENLEKIFPPQINLNKEIILYGEGFGGKIQAGGKYAQKSSFILFDIKIGNWWMGNDIIREIGIKDLGIEVVPVVGYGCLDLMIELVKEGLKSTFGDFIAEGIVARPSVELQERRGERIITKIKHKDFF